MSSSSEYDIRSYKVVIIFNPREQHIRIDFDHLRTVLLAALANSVKVDENDAVQPMARRRVGLLGASGETGSSILEGLIEDAGFVRHPYYQLPLLHD